MELVRSMIRHLCSKTDTFQGTKREGGITGRSTDTYSNNPTEGHPVECTSFCLFVSFEETPNKKM